MPTPRKTSLIKLKHPPTDAHGEVPFLISTTAVGQQIDYGELLSGACFFDNLKQGDIISLPYQNGFYYLQITAAQEHNQHYTVPEYDYQIIAIYDYASARWLSSEQLQAQAEQLQRLKTNLLSFRNLARPLTELHNKKQATTGRNLLNLNLTGTNSAELNAKKGIKLFRQSFISQPTSDQEATTNRPSF